MSEIKKTSKAIIWSAVQGWGAQLIGLVVFTLLAWYLSPEDFGLVALAMVFIAFTQMFVDQGFSLAIIQHPKVTEEHISTTFWTNCVFGISLTVVAYFLADIVSEIFKQPGLKDILQWLSLVLFLNSLASIQAALFRKALEFKPLAFSSITSATIGGLVGVIMAYYGYGVWSLVVQQLLQSILQIVLLWVQSSWRPSFYWNFRIFKELFSYSVHVLGINLFEFFNRYSDNLLIGYYLGPTALGYYALAYKFYQTLVKLIGGLANQVAFSSFSSFQHDIPRVREAFYSSTQFMAFIAFPLFLGVSLIAPEIFTILLGEKWQNSILVFQILMAVALIECVLFFNGSVMMALGKPNWRLKLNMLNAIVNVIGFYIAVRWGIEFVALAYVLRTYLLSPIALYCVKMLIGIKFFTYFTGLLKPALCAVTVVVLMFFVKKYLLISLSSLQIALASILFCMICYLILSFAFMHRHLVTLRDSVLSIIK